MAKLLIVEDDESTREFLKFVLENAGHQVSAAADGQAALDAVSKNPPELILLDIMLPEIHGFEVCHRLKSDPATQKVKIVMLSAKSFPADIKQARHMGADGFLAKPVNPAELINGLKAVLTGQSLF